MKMINCVKNAQKSQDTFLLELNDHQFQISVKSLKIDLGENLCNSAEMCLESYNKKNYDMNANSLKAYSILIFHNSSVFI
jgi:hypothetical protein